MIAGIGVDLVDIARFERTLERTPRLRERLFTANEQPMPARSLAARYAAGEIGQGRILREFEDQIGTFENVARGSSFGRLDPATGVVRLR